MGSRRLGGFAPRDHAVITFPLTVSMSCVKKVADPLTSECDGDTDYRDTISSSTMIIGVGFERSGTLK